MAEFLNVNDVLSNLDLHDTMVVAEFGCGSAAFAMSLAKRVSKGRVYALDIQEEKLSALRGKMVLEKIGNIYTIHCDLEAPKGSTLHDNFLDVVLIPNVLFQAEDKYAILQEAKRVLKTKGQLLVVDWLKSVPFSPKTGLIKPEEMKKMADKLNLSFKKEFAAGDYHYGLLFTKL